MRNIKLASVGYWIKKNGICIAYRYCYIWVLHCLYNSCQIIVLIAWSYLKDTRRKSRFIGRCRTGRSRSGRSRFYSKRRCQRVPFSLLWVRSGNGLPNQHRTKHATNYCLPTSPRKCRVWHAFQLLQKEYVLAISWSLDKRDWCAFRQIRQNCFDDAGFNSISYFWKRCDHWWHHRNIQGQPTSA